MFILDSIDEGLWLGLSDSESEGLFVSDVGDVLAHVFEIVGGDITSNQYQWANEWTDLGLDTTLNGVKMSSSGVWGIENENRKLNAVCVYNIIPDDCSRCLNKEFCRYKDESKTESECICPDMTEGEICEKDLCPCLNGGQCRLNNDTNDTECLCPYPFHGNNCELGEIRPLQKGLTICLRIVYNIWPI